MGSGTYEDMGTSGIKTDDASPHFSLQHFFQQRLVRRRLPRPNRLRNSVSFLSRFCNASVKVSAHARLAAVERRVAPTHRPARPSHSVCGPLLRFEEPPFGPDPFGCPNSSLLGSKLPSTVCQKLFFFSTRLFAPAHFLSGQQGLREPKAYTLLLRLGSQRQVARPFGLGEVEYAVFQ